MRQVRFKQPAVYLQRAARNEFIAQSHEVARDELPFEFMLNALRLRDGIASNLFSERTGLPLTSIDAALTAAEARGLLTCDHSGLRPTPLGFQFLSDLQALFLPRQRTETVRREPH